MPLSSISERNLLSYMMSYMASEQAPVGEEGHGIQLKAPEKASRWTLSLEYFITDICQEWISMLAHVI